MLLRQHKRGVLLLLGSILLSLLVANGVDVNNALEVRTLLVATAAKLIQLRMSLLQRVLLRISKDDLASAHSIVRLVGVGV